MKTKDLIAALQAEDPSGELECCIANTDIHYVSTKHAYWDGCLQVLERNPDEECYNIIGGKYVSNGVKVVLKPLSIREAIFNKIDMPVTFDSDYTKDKYTHIVEAYRCEAKEIKNDVEKTTFVWYIGKRFGEWFRQSGSGFDFNEEDFEKAARTFFDESGMQESDPMPEDIKQDRYASWNDRRFKQWDRELYIGVEDGKLFIKRR